MNDVGIQQSKIATNITARDLGILKYALQYALDYLRVPTVSHPLPEP